MTQPYPPRPPQNPAPWGPQPGWPAQPVQQGWNHPPQGYGQQQWQQAPGGFRPAPPPGYQPSGHQQPRGGGSPLGRILIVLVAVCGVLLAGVIVANMMNGRTGTDPRPVETYTPPPPDLNPPDLPAPKTYGEATEWLRENPFYQQQISTPTDCNNLQPIDAEAATESQLNAHLQLVTACLMKVWNAPVEAAGFVMPRPPATVYSQPIQTACGKLDSLRNASYCGADQRIYYGIELPSAFPPDLRNTKFLMEMVLGHEFGHAIQYRTGIGISNAAWEQRATTKAQGNLFSRRLEVQADCFAGMWIGAVAPSQDLSASDLDNLKVLAYNIGDDVLTGQPNIDSGHGLGRTRQRWFTTGLTGGSGISQCNTYVAADSQVR